MIYTTIPLIKLYLKSRNADQNLSEDNEKLEESYNYENFTSFKFNSTYLNATTKEDIFEADLSAMNTFWLKFKESKNFDSLMFYIGYGTKHCLERALGRTLHPFNLPSRK